MSENSKCEAHFRVKTGGFCPVCLINERDRLCTRLDQERQRREQAEGLLRDARVEMACRLPATDQIGRIDKHFGEWND